MMTTLTAQDVRDADFAKTINAQARSDQTSPDALIREFFNHDLMAFRAQYERGVKLLRDYIVLASDRSVADPMFDAATCARIVSPIVTVPSGHIGTSEARRAVALAQR